MRQGGQSGRAPLGALLALLLGGWTDGAHPEMSLAIVPPFVEKLVDPGSEISDLLAFTNRGDEPVRISVDFADFGVTEGGEVADAPPGSDRSSLLRRLRISPLTARVVPGQQIFFRYEVEAPEEFAQLRAMIYLSSAPETAPAPNQVQVVARMGVPLYVENVKSRPASLRVESLAWSRAPDAADRLRLVMEVTNDGDRNIRPTGFVQVESKVARFAESFEFNAGREPVLPGQKRRWEQHFGPVPSGALGVKLRMATSARTAFENEAQVEAAGS